MVPLLETSWRLSLRVQRLRQQACEPRKLGVSKRLGRIRWGVTWWCLSISFAGTSSLPASSAPWMPPLLPFGAPSSRWPWGRGVGQGGGGVNPAGTSCTIDFVFDTSISPLEWLQPPSNPHAHAQARWGQLWMGVEGARAGLEAQTRLTHTHTRRLSAPSPFQDLNRVSLSCPHHRTLTSCSWRCWRAFSARCWHVRWHAWAAPGCASPRRQTPPPATLAWR